MSSYTLLLPLFVLAGFSFLLFAIDAWTQQLTPTVKRVSFWMMLVGLVIAMLLLQPPLPGVFYAKGMLVWDGLSYFFSWIVLLTLLFVLLLSENFKEFEGLRLSTYYGLLLLAGCGLIFLVSANDFLMVFIGIELFGIPSFIVAGYLRHKERSNEAAVKLFLIGAFSTAMLVYGVALLYGIVGSTSLSVIRDNVNLLSAMAPLSLMAVIFIIVSFGFKIAMVPFHMWVPDVFEGAPKPVAALLSVAPKVAGAAIALRVFNLVLPGAGLSLFVILAALAAATMTVGNIVGLQQTNVIRLLAYSSIAHMGYLLMGLTAGGELGLTGAYLYGWIYLFMNLGAFAIVIVHANNTGSDELSSYVGLARRSPGLAALMTLFLVSLAGIPPTAGFVAKFYVFLAAYKAGWIWLVALGAVNSVISAAYYFRIVHWMYFKSPNSETSLVIRPTEFVTLAATSLITLGLGLAPQWFVVTAQGLVVKP